MSLSVSRFTRTLSGVATAAMVLTGISLVAVAPANAEPATVTVTGNDIRPNEATYPGWHEGYDNTDRAYFVADDGLHLGVGDDSQVLNGLDSPYPTNKTELGNLITSAAVTTTEGLATLQVPLFFGPGATQDFTTLWSADVVTGPNSFSLDSQWVTTGNIGTAVTAGTQDTLSNLLTALEGQGSIRLLGFGVQANEVDPAVVTSLTWNGTEYVFQPYVAADPTSHVTVNQRDTATATEQNDPTLPGYNYEQWHEGLDAIGYAVKSDGVHLGVSTSSTFIKGTTVNKAAESSDSLVTQAELQELISKASVEVAGTGQISFQVPLHFGNDGSAIRAAGNSFATLRMRGLTAGTHTFSLADQWSSSRITPAFADIDDHALGDLLDSLYASYDYVWLAGFGVQADASTPAVVPSLVWDGTEYTFFQPETSTCTPTPGTTPTTNLDSNGWDFTRTRATGHNEFVDGGLRVWTDGVDGATNKVAGDHPITFDLPLADVGVPSIDLTNYAAEATSIPGFQLGVDFDNDGTQDGYLVGEVSNGDQWWASASIVSDSTWVGLPVPAPGTSSRAISGTLNQYLVAYPDARATSYGYSLGSNVIGDSIIHSITVGCAIYGFDLIAAAEPTDTVTVSDTQIGPDETPYAGWHEGYTNTTRAYSVDEDGLHLADGAHSQIINGLAAPLATSDLESLITGASVTSTSGRTAFQVAITYGTYVNTIKGTTTTFTTLRPATSVKNDGTPTHFSVTDLWTLSSPLVDNTTGAATSIATLTLADMLTFINAQGNVKLFGYGVQADANQHGVVSSIVWDGTEYNFVPAPAVAPANTVRVTEAEIALTETGNYLQWHEGTGGAAYDDTAAFSVAEDGLHLVIDAPGGPRWRSQIIKGLDTPVAGADLYSLLTSMAGISVVSGEVTYQVPVNFEGGWSTLRSASLDAGQHSFSLNDLWYSSKNIGTSILGDAVVDGAVVVHAYALGDILDAMNALGNAEAIGFGVQTQAPAVVSSIVWGDTEYVFSGPIEGTQPTISGDAVVGSTLTADAGAWTPEGVALHYQWSADGSDIGTDSSTYVLTADDYTKTISVKVTGSKVGYTDVFQISDGTDPVAAADLVAGTPTITGAAQVGQQLTATPGTWSPSGVAFAYQWQVNGADVVGATSSTYTPVLADIGKTVTVVVTGSLYGYTTDTASVTTAAVSGSAVVTVLPTITGSPVVDGTLTANPGNWEPSGVTFTYQWNVGGTPVSGATAQTYSPRPADVGSTVTVTVTGALSGSIPVSVNSAATDDAVLKANITSVTPALSGTEKVGNTLTADAGTWAPTGVALSYQWNTGGHPILGATESTYVLTGADAGATISVTVTGTKAGYNTATATSLGTDGIADGDLTVGAVTISGTAQVGETIIASAGTWGPGTVGLAYQWYVGAVIDDADHKIGGATSASFDVTSTTWNGELIVVVTGSATGYATATAQAATSAVAAGDLTTATPTITGTPIVDGTLTAHAGVWGPSGVALAYQWVVGGTDVAGADGTASSYTPVASDVGKTVTVKVTGTLAAYTSESTLSAPTGVVLGVFDTVTPTISGTAQVGAMLTATAAAWTPAATTATYQWYAGGTAITGATSLTYTVAAADAAKKITFSVTGSATNYVQATATSVQTGTVIAGVITPVNPTITGTTTVGQVLTADAHATGWVPTSVSLSYQWKANGTSIGGATSSSYTLTSAELGDTMTVTVTGAKTGYTAQSATSLGTDEVINDHVVATRLAGASRYDTAVAISKQFTSATRVYIATGTGYADALSAGPAAAHFNAPLLLTTPDSLPAVVVTELNRLHPAKIVIVGGTGVVSAAVETALKNLSFHPSVQRVAGADRYATSRALATATWSAGSLGTAYLATGTNFPDALSAGPAAAHFDGPVILIPGMASSIDAATRSLLSTLGVDKVKIAGGTGVISPAIEAQARVIFGSADVTRNGAGDRYSTSVAINADEFGSAPTVYLATGSGYADALAGSALAGANGAPLFVTQTTCIPTTVMDAIEALGSTTVVLLGGTGVLTAGVEHLTTCG